MVGGWWYASPQQQKQEDSLDKLATTLPAAYPWNVPTSLQTLSCLLLEIINTLETTNYSTNKISWSLSLPLCDKAWAGKCSNTATTSSERQAAIWYNQDIRSTYETVASLNHSLKKRICYLCVDYCGLRSVNIVVLKNNMQNRGKISHQKFYMFHAFIRCTTFFLKRKSTKALRYECDFIT